MIFFQTVPAVLSSMPPYRLSQAGAQGSALGAAPTSRSCVITGSRVPTGCCERSHVSRVLTSNRELRRISIAGFTGDDLGPITTSHSSSISGTTPVRDIASAFGRPGGF